jgi:hypothetical protein
MKSEVDALRDAIERAMHTGNVDKLARAKVLAALEVAVAAQREHAAAIAELDAALENFRPPV